MELIGRGGLVPLNANHLGWLYWLAVSGDGAWNWRWRGHHPSPEEFAARLWSDGHLQRVIVDSSTGRLTGFVQSFNYDPVARHAHISAILAPEFRRLAWPIRSIQSFIGSLFDDWNLAKVYMETHDQNEGQFKWGLRQPLRLEACRRGHISIGGKLLTSKTYALYRDDWVTAAHRTSEILNVFGRG
jgi:RimJ/RimL family protein N-acetyltransferase